MYLKFTGEHSRRHPLGAVCFTLIKPKTIVFTIAIVYLPNYRYLVTFGNVVDNPI